MNAGEAGGSGAQHAASGTEILTGPGRGKGPLLIGPEARARHEALEAEKKKAQKKDKRKSGETKSRAQRDRERRAKAKASAEGTPAGNDADAKRPYKRRTPLSLVEIKKYQRSSEPLIQRAPFQRLVKEVSDFQCGRLFSKQGFR